VIYEYLLQHWLNLSLYISKILKVAKLGGSVFFYTFESLYLAGSFFAV